MQASKKQELVKKEIMDACPSCRGHGCKSCAAKVEKINLWANAGIPVAYWEYTLATFNGNDGFKKIIQSYVQDINKFYIDGKSIIFYGSIGTGKTFGACEMLKAGLMNGLSGKFTSLNEMMNNILYGKNESYEFKDILLNVDQLVIDEFDTRHMPNTENAQNIFGTNIEFIVRTRLQNKMPIIFCTNNSNVDDLFSGTFFHSIFSSLFSKNNLIRIPVGGIDLRKV